MALDRVTLLSPLQPRKLLIMLGTFRARRDGPCCGRCAEGGAEAHDGGARRRSDRDRARASPGELWCEVEIGAVVGANVEGRIYALHNRCPHRGAPLCRGLVGGTVLAFRPGELVYGLDGCILRRPWHRWEFASKRDAAHIIPSAIA